MKLVKILKNSCFQLVAIFLIAFLFGKIIPDDAKALSYSISLTLKWALMFGLPLVVFTCLFNSMLAYQDKAVGMLIVLVVGVFLSNLLSTLAAYLSRMDAPPLSALAYPVAIQTRWSSPIKATATWRRSAWLRSCTLPIAARKSL